MLSRWNPDKHLQIHNPRLRMALRMTWYSMVASSIGGLLFALPFLLDFPNSVVETECRRLCWPYSCGGTALFQRLFASVLIGAAMAIVTGRFFQKITNPWVYKMAMALTTAAIVHLFAPIQLVRFYLSELTVGDYEPFLEMVTVIAVYAGAIYLSQVMAQKYIREITT